MQISDASDMISLEPASEGIKQFLDRFFSFPHHDGINSVMQGLGNILRDEVLSARKGHYPPFPIIILSEDLYIPSFHLMNCRGHADRSQSRCNSGDTRIDVERRIGRDNNP